MFDNKIFLIERPEKYTMFFLLKRKEDMNMETYMQTHNISEEALKDNTNQIFDFYNDLVKFQNKNKAFLNHLTIFTKDENEIPKYLKNIEKDPNFIKWITIEDDEWLDKIYKYFINDKWFKNIDDSKEKNQYRI
jgi:hypothetical protein